MKQCWNLALLTVAVAVLAACSGGSTDSGGGGGGNGPSQVTLSTSVNPGGAGTVSPSSGTFDSGSSVTVEATPQEGWAFENWSGDQSSQQNPFTFTINQNTQLTANFSSTSSIFSVDLTLADAENELDGLQFGLNSNGSSGFDDGLDLNAPPPPPDGALNGFFKTGDLRLWNDFRNFESEQESWNLQYSIGSGDTLTISWTVQETRLNGTLLIESKDGSISVDMQTESSLDITTSGPDSLAISYRLGGQ